MTHAENEHYYTAQPESAHERRTLRVPLLGFDFEFSTDAGVFSKDELDPGTRLLIESAGPLDGLCLDLGCGWGAVGAALARANPEAEFWLTDINERAAGLAEENLRRNGLTNARVAVGDGFHALPQALAFRHILTNPPIRAGKERIYALFDEAAARLIPGGDLTIVIRKKQGAPSAKAHLQALFGACEDIARDGGYHILRSVRSDS